MARLPLQLAITTAIPHIMVSKTVVVLILSNNRMIVTTITGSTTPAIVDMANGVVILTTIEIRNQEWMRKKF